MGSPNFLIKILYVKRNYYCDSSFTQFDLVKVTVILLVIKKKILYLRYFIYKTIIGLIL